MTCRTEQYYVLDLPLNITTRKDNPDILGASDILNVYIFVVRYKCAVLLNLNELD